MKIRCMLAVFAALVCAASSFAQEAWQFRWQKGQALTYKIKHVTTAAEVLDNGKSESHSKLDLVKRWQVAEVDDKGVATLEMSLVAMRNEQRRPNGDSVLFDSQDLEKSTPALREQMSKFIGKTLAVLRVDGYGRVVEVKQGQANRYEAEPPFVIVFPAAKAEAGQVWRRPYTIVLDPPLGTGEKYQAEQRYECKKIEAGKASLTVATEFKTAPDNARDRLPMLQKEVQGEIVFDVPAGRLTAIRLSIDKTIENHAGKGSSYRFQSEYVEELVAVQ